MVTDEKVYNMALIRYRFGTLLIRPSVSGEF
jgi:hypothetical protein